ncbi:helix-turn-helix domain-containing protein [bacterium D16-50]|nr:helix-turn-helix domain-containing protein [bacterium D16-50]
MRNKKLIPFEVIEKAVAGGPEAVDAVLRHYITHIKYLSMYEGYINDDT